MKVTACSIFRDSAGYVGRYMAQMHNLAEHVDLRLVLTYGDCTDDTARFLADCADGLTVEIGEYSHGGPKFPSIDHPARWEQIAKVVRHTLDRVGDPGDALIWVESDLIWHSGTMLALLEDLEKVPAVAPGCYADGSSRWYDTWGFRKNGAQFAAFPPHHQDGRDPGTGLVKIDSCGSCWASRGGEWRDWDGIWPYPAAGRLWFDPDTRVWHP